MAVTRVIKPEPGSHDVTFTEFRVPDGKTRPTWITRAPDVAALARRLREAGCRFEIEVLTDAARTVSMTVERGPEDDPEVVARRLVGNGKGVPAAVDALVAEAAAKVLS